MPGLPDRLDERLERLAAQFQCDPRISFAYLFGSVARGRPGPLSDIDIAVRLADGVDLAAVQLELIGLACDTLGTDDVDLVVLNAVPLMLRYRIVRDRVILSERDRPGRAAFESLTLRQGWDFLPRERQMLERRYGLGH